MAKMSEMGLVDQKEYSEIAEQGVGGGLWAPGIHDVVVEAAYIRKTEKGAKMLELELHDAEGNKLFYSTCTHSGDLKGNKPTFGIHNMKHFLDAVKDPDPDMAVVTIKRRNEDTEVMAFTALQGKKLKIGVIELETDYNGGTVKNDIKGFLDAQGKNAKGEEIADDMAAKIDEKPRKVEKGAQAKPQTAEEKAAMSSSGWGSK